MLKRKRFMYTSETLLVHDASFAEKLASSVLIISSILFSYNQVSGDHVDQQFFRA